MTREEAISIMKVIVHMLEEKYDTDRVEEAVDMAIKALEQKPTIEVLQEIRQEIKTKQTDTEYLQGICPFGPCGEWYDGVDDGLKIIALNIIDGHMEEIEHDQ